MRRSPDRGDRGQLVEHHHRRHRLPEQGLQPYAGGRVGLHPVKLVGRDLPRIQQRHPLRVGSGRGSRVVVVGTRPDHRDPGVGQRLDGA